MWIVHVLSHVSTVWVLAPDAMLLWQTVVYHFQRRHLLQLPEQVHLMPTVLRCYKEKGCSFILKDLNMAEDASSNADIQVNNPIKALFTWPFLYSGVTDATQLRTVATQNVHYLALCCPHMSDVPKHQPQSAPCCAEAASAPQIILMQHHSIIADTYYEVLLALGFRLPTKSQRLGEFNTFLTLI